MSDETRFQNWDGSWTTKPSVSMPDELHTWVHDLRMVNRLYELGLISEDAYPLAAAFAVNGTIVKGHGSC
jgi:hypothetical protein